MTNEMTKQDLLGEMLCIADSKWVLGHWYVKVIPNGHTIPDFSSMAGMAQDELGHTRALFSFLEQTEQFAEGQLEFGRSSDQLHNMELLDQPPANWGDFVVTAYLAEQALWSMLESFVAGSNTAISNICKKFSEEGYFHRLYIDGWVASLTDEEKANAVDALQARLPTAKKWFLPASGRLNEAGIRPLTDAECGSHFDQGVGDLAKALGCELPEKAPEVGDWDQVRRRSAGSKMPEGLWEFIVPTSQEAVMARRPLSESVKDNIDLFVKAKKVDKTEPFFEQ